MAAQALQSASEPKLSLEQLDRLLDPLTKVALTEAAHTWRNLVKAQV